MTVNNDVHCVFFHASEVDFAEDRYRSPVQDVGKVGGDHGAAPAIR